MFVFVNVRVSTLIEHVPEAELLLGRNNRLCIQNLLLQWCTSCVSVWNGLFFLVVRYFDEVAFLEGLPHYFFTNADALLIRKIYFF